MAGPQNVVVGDQDQPTQLPETEVPKEELVEERKLAKFSKTAEFKRLKDFMEARMKFYQNYLPDGRRVQGDPKGNGLQVDIPAGDLTANWVAACIVISEFQAVLDTYDQASEAVNGRKNQ